MMLWKYTLPDAVVADVVAAVEAVVAVVVAVAG